MSSYHRSARFRRLLLRDNLFVPSCLAAVVGFLGGMCSITLITAQPLLSIPLVIISAILGITGSVCATQRFHTLAH
jgi:hypothetical protein